MYCLTCVFIYLLTIYTHLVVVVGPLVVIQKSREHDKLSARVGLDPAIQKVPHRLAGEKISD